MTTLIESEHLTIDGLEPKGPVEARAAARLPASRFPSITGVRLSPYGTDARLLNMSAGGVLIESATRVRLGAKVTVTFDGTFSPSSVEGRVARSSVAGVDKKGVLTYHVGIEFTNPIALTEASAATNTDIETSPQPEAASPVLAVPVNRW